MIDLERRFGPWSIRVWGLILNFIGNALAIYGAVGVMQNGSRRPFLVTGLALTVLCILLLAKPSGISKNE